MRRHTGQLEARIKSRSFSRAGFPLVFLGEGEIFKRADQVIFGIVHFVNNSVHLGKLPIVSLG